MELGMRSTNDVATILSTVANETLNNETKPITEEELDKANVLLRVAKHTIQNISMIVTYAKMKRLDLTKIDKLPHIEIQ